MRSTIVVPTWNSARTLGRVLDAAIPQAPVIVVDDESWDGTPRIAASRGARVLTVNRRSVAAARNAGWKAATSEFVLFLDSDAVPEPDWVENLETRLSRADADIVGGDVHSRPTTRFADVVDRMYRAMDAGLFADDSVMLPGMNLGVRRDLIDTVAFDETLPGAMCEDVDFLVRARRAGARIAFEPKAIVHHHHPSDLASFVRQEVRHGRGRALLLERHPERESDAAVRSWPRWMFDCTAGAPWHLAAAWSKAGPDPAVWLLHWLRMSAGNWGYLKERAKG